MPVLVLAISEDLDKLFQNRSPAAIASLGELGRVVIVAVNLAIVFVVAVLRAKNGWADRAGKVIDMILVIESCDVRAPQGAIALVADEVEPPEVVSLAEWILPFSFFLINWKKLRSYNITAILGSELAKVDHQD